MQFYRDAVPLLAGVDVLHDRGMRAMLVTARLADGISLAQATAEIEVLARRTDSDHLDQERDWRRTWVARAMPLGQAQFWPGARAQIITMFIVLIAVAAGVLVIACANLASLLLTRAAQREREISVRIALGARSGTVLRLLVAESLLISIGGCVAGLLLGVVLTRGLAGFPRLFSVPLAIDISVNWRVGAFSTSLDK